MKLSLGASYDFWKLYSESGEKTESDENRISISNFFLGMVYTLVLTHCTLNNSSLIFHDVRGIQPHDVCA